MKTALLTTCWLDNAEYFKKTEKWLKYYQELQPKLKFDSIHLIDNASHPANIDAFYQRNKISNYEIITRDEHYGRPAHVDYKYLWYAIGAYHRFFGKGYDKVVYMDNDFYILSPQMVDIVNYARGWAVPYCPRHTFPETGLQVVTADSESYKDFMKDDLYRFNGIIEMEHALKPFVAVNKSLIGDRYPEYPKAVPDNADFNAQTPLSLQLEFRK